MMSNTMAAAIGIGGIIVGYLFAKYQDKYMNKSESPTNKEWDQIIGDGVPDDENGN